MRALVRSDRGTSLRSYRARALRSERRRVSDSDSTYLSVSAFVIARSDGEISNLLGDYDMSHRVLRISCFMNRIIILF